MILKFTHLPQIINTSKKNILKMTKIDQINLNQNKIQKKEKRNQIIMSKSMKIRIEIISMTTGGK